MATAAPVAQTETEQTDDSPARSPARIHLGQLAWSSLVAVVPLAYVLLVGESVWPAAALLAAGLIALALRRPSGTRSDATSALTTFRVCVSLWIFTAFVVGQSKLGVVAVGAVVAAAAVLAESPIRRLGDAFVPLVSELPGLRPAPAKLNLRVVTQRLSVIALIAGVILGTLTATGYWSARTTTWLWLLAAVTMTVLPTISLIRAVRRILAGRRIERAVSAAVSEYAPEFVLYTSRPDDASYQVLMWLPYLQRTGRRFLIVARTNDAAEAIALQTEVPVLVRRGVAELDDVVQPCVRAAFYVNASSGNGAFVRYNQLTHVYLGHGDSDKPPSYNPTHAMYDKIFAAGEAAVERYAAHGVKIALEKFDIVGRPQVETVEPGIPGVVPQTVLYAPTWRGHVTETLLYSLPIGERIVSALLRRGMTVIFRPHPFSYDFPEDVVAIERIHALLRDDAIATGRQHFYAAAAETERGIFECINASDAMVSDVSSVVSDYLFSEKPFAMVAGRSDPVDFVRDYPVARAAYVIDGAADNVDDVLDEMLGPDPERPIRRRVRTHYLGEFPVSSYSQAFVDACIRIVDTPAPRSSEEADSREDVQRARVLDRLRAQFASYGKEFTFAFAAVIVFVLAAAGFGGLAALLASLLLLIVLVLSRRGVLSVAALNGLLGVLAPARTLLTLALLPAWPAAVLTTPLVAAVTVLMTLTAAEVAMRYAWMGPGTGVVHLAGAESPPVPRRPRGAVHVANLVALIGAWLSVLLGGSAGLLAATLVIVLAAAVLAIDTVSAGVRRLTRLRDIAGDLPSVIARYAPTFTVYFSSNIGADYQVGMWLPYFKRIGSPFVIVTRTVAMMEAISRLDPAPVIYRPSLRSLEDIICPSLTTAFYVNNAVRNTHLIERRELTHVWLNHGDSEKPACYNPVHAIYDKLFTAGEAGIDRYARHGVEHPAGEVRDRRSSAGGADHPRPRADRHPRPGNRSVRTDLEGAVRGLAGLFPASGQAHRREAAQPRADRDLPRASLQREFPGITGRDAGNRQSLAG